MLLEGGADFREFQHLRPCAQVPFALGNARLKTVDPTTAGPAEADGESRWMPWKRFDWI